MKRTVLLLGSLAACLLLSSCSQQLQVPVHVQAKVTYYLYTTFLRSDGPSREARCYFMIENLTDADWYHVGLILTHPTWQFMEKGDVRELEGPFYWYVSRVKAGESVRVPARRFGELVPSLMEYSTDDYYPAMEIVVGVSGFGAKSRFIQGKWELPGVKFPVSYRRPAD
jgi:hypothetical protein